MKIFIEGIASVLIFNALATPAMAQDWIKPFCCPSLSCQQVSDRDLVQTNAGFHIVSLDETVAYNDHRLFSSGDNTIRLCTDYLPEPERVQNADRLILKCLYVPLAF